MPQRPTSHDVATLAGVSRTTVSFVLNDRTDVKIPEETRRRVLDAAKELGYHPHASARRLAGGRSHVIALVLRQSPEQVASDAVLAETLRGLAAAARTGGFRVMVEPFALDDTSGNYADLLRAQHADGLVVSGPRVDDPSLIELVRDAFPIVLQGALPDIGAPSVDVDNVAGARGAVEHLDLARPSPDRLHHQCPPRLHRRPGAARRLSAGDRGGRTGRGPGPRRRGGVRRAERPCRDGRAPRADQLRCGLRGERCRRPRSDRRAAGGGQARPPRHLDRRLRRRPPCGRRRPPLTTVRLPAPSRSARRRTGPPRTDRRSRGSRPRPLLPTELVVRACGTLPASRT